MKNSCQGKFSNFSLVLDGKNWVIQVWNDTRVSTWWQKFHFWMNYSFNPLNCMGKDERKCIWKQMKCWHLFVLFCLVHELPNATQSPASVPPESRPLCSLSECISVIRAIASHVTELKPDSYVRWCPDHQTWMTPLCSLSLTLFCSPPQSFPLCTFLPLLGKVPDFSR